VAIKDDVPTFAESCNAIQKLLIELGDCGWGYEATRFGAQLCLSEA
jgi:hypothetical protein